VLRALQRSATLESAESSSRIEGVTARPERLQEILAKGGVPANRSEGEIAGYRDALALIHASYPEMTIAPNLIRQLHRDLFKYVPGDGGILKSTDNEITATDGNGEKTVIFRAVPAVSTPAALEDLCKAYRSAADDQIYNRFLIIGTFVFDFLCIHPFRDGNGRVSRLLTTLLLYQTGVTAVRYVSLERVIEQSKDTYYSALNASSQKWLKGKHRLDPWWSYFLGIIIAAYRELDERLLASKVPSRAGRVRLAIEQLPEQFTVAELARACPGVSRTTLNRVLRALRLEGKVRVVYAGKHARWAKNDDS
jgi:Fic family protein